jgi:hypothetical protein
VCILSALRRYILYHEEQLTLGQMLSVEDAILSEEAIADGWVEGLLHANPPF